MTSGSRLERRAGAAANYPAPFLDALAQRLASLPVTDGPSLVAIDGWGCGGKTALAEGLLDRLEPRVTYLSTDEFFAGFGQVDPGPVAHLRWAEFVGALASLRERGAAEIRPFDWENHRIGRAELISGRAWLVEGLFSLRSDVAPSYDFRIWVEGRLDNRLARVASRDGAHMLPFWEDEWVPREQAYGRAQQPWNAADLIVAGADLSLQELGAQIAERGRDASG